MEVCNLVNVIYLKHNEIKSAKLSVYLSYILHIAHAQAWCYLNPMKDPFLMVITWRHNDITYNACHYIIII